MNAAERAGWSQDWEALARRHVGDGLFDGLLQAMLDSAMAPIDLAHATGPTLVALRDEATKRLREGFESESHQVLAELEATLPWYLEGVPLPAAALQLGTHRAYFNLPDAIYDARPPGSRVLERVPDLAHALDDDGLVDVAGLDAQDQGLFTGPWAVHYHQLLRRGFASNVNDALLRTLIGIARDTGSRLRLGIDHRRIWPRDEFVHWIEEDYWYGPHLTEEWLDDPGKASRTVHEDPEGDEALGGYRAFFAYWRMAGDTEKVVQMEELPTLGSAMDRRYLCRYLHAIRDIHQGVFIHCDGAVRMYEAATFDDRVSDSMPSGTRADRYCKVFRIDGSIPTQQWSQIVAKWFRHNQLSVEYLSTLTPD